MAKRAKMSRKKSKSDFKRKAKNVHPKNTRSAPPSMRGGIRL